MRNAVVLNMHCVSKFLRIVFIKMASWTRKIYVVNICDPEVCDLTSPKPS